MPVIGTAGHVDHGKSTLIERITGRNPDRWSEERERGLTIDLGFAWTTLPDGTEVSFVDVPGHERFLKNMLAGIEAIDVALFVVAADEGWMPQSEEHLAVLDLLAVDRGVIAVTKADAVESDLADLAVAETAEQLGGSSLERARIVRVSGLTGDGVPELLEALAGELPAPTEPGDRPRLWIDRSFAVAGAGTIVTGTLLDGSLSIDDAVIVYPRGRPGRVRGIQSHEQSHDSIGPGRRVALNLGGIDHDELSRGDMVGLPDQWATSDRLLVSLRSARFVDDLPQRGAYQIHIGSAALRVDITGVADGYAVVQTERAIPVASRDRFILRDTGRRLVVGGGRVLDPAPGRTRRALQTGHRIDAALSPDDVARELLAIRGSEDVRLLSAHSGGGAPGGAVIVSDDAVTQNVLQALTDRSVGLVEDEHSKHPLRPGLPLATLAERLDVSAALAEKVVEGSDDLVRVGPVIAHAGHEPRLTDDQAEAWTKTRERIAESLSVPLESELEVDAEIVALKIRSGDLVRVSADLLYLPSQLEEIRSVVASLEGEFTVADFRDRAGLTRKYAVPILEWSDREGLTVRRGDVRRLR